VFSIKNKLLKTKIMKNKSLKDLVELRNAYYSLREEWSYFETTSLKNAIIALILVAERQDYTAIKDSCVDALNAINDVYTKIKNIIDVVNYEEKESFDEQKIINHKKKMKTKMIELVENGDEIILEFTLPSDKTQEELIWQMSEELDALLEGYLLYEKNIKITGKITTGMCLWIGYNLSYICKTVSIFVPQENTYLCVIEN